MTIVNPSTTPTRCRRCGYDVQSLIPSDPLAEFHCPECGTAWTQESLQQLPASPWSLVWLPCVLALLPSFASMLCLEIFQVDWWQDAVSENPILHWLDTPPTAGLLAAILTSVRLRRANRHRRDFERFSIPRTAVIAGEALLGTAFLSLIIWILHLQVFELALLCVPILLVVGIGVLLNRLLRQSARRTDTIA